jgi:hypothetical protein
MPAKQNSALLASKLTASQCEAARFYQAFQGAAIRKTSFFFTD